MLLWLALQVLRHPPFPNGLDGVAKDKGERNSKPFQYLWVDPFFTTVRRLVCVTDSFRLWCYRRTCRQCYFRSMVRVRMV